MQSEQMWFDEAASGIPSLTRRRVLAGSLKLAGAGALALTLAGGTGQVRLAFAQEATPPAGEVEGGIQVGTTDDTATDDSTAAVEGEATADDTATDDQTREERRAAREAEEAAGGVAAVPSTGVGAIGSSLGGVIGAIGLAGASVAAALFTRRPSADADEATE